MDKEQERAERALITETEALDMITDVLSCKKWDADSQDLIARIVRATGRTIAEVNK